MGQSAHSSGLHLTAPWLYLVFAPFFTLWDGISMLSMSRLHGFLTGCALLYVLWRIARRIRRGTSWRRELAVLAISLVLFVAFVVAGALWHRPMLALAGIAPDDVVVDYHSHTNASRDVRKSLMRGFDLSASRRWHGRAGFDAFFVTDHNEIHPTISEDRHRPSACPGTEVSAWDAHIVLLGPAPKISRDTYAASLDGLLTLLRISDSAYGSLSIASLPEYERSHWNRLDLLVSSGLDGFEVVNAAPKANELSIAQRDTVIALARRSNRLLAGVSDSHGWGATSMVWNLVHIPGWRESADTVCRAILSRLRTGTASTRIIERRHLRADSAWPRWLTPLGVVWETWRSMGWPLTVSWLLWTWLGYLSFPFRPRIFDAPLSFSRYRFRRARPRGHE